MRYPLFVLILSQFLTACGGSDSGSTSPSVAAAQIDNRLKSTALLNQAAYIPAQCYTKTEDAQGKVHNPCFACHQASQEPNFFSDEDLQTAYSFAEYPLTNHWTNLFKDRSAAVAAISDADMQNYLRVNNYQDGNKLILAEKLQNLPAEWDYHGDGKWDGFMPDCYFNVDQQGFDHAPDGSYTGWRAFGYDLFLGTFWPANGSTDDVLIRLPAAFRQDANGQFDLDVYKINFAIVEALIKRKNVVLDNVDETRYGVDLDKDGQLGIAKAVVFDYAPLEGRYMSYVGKAKVELEAGEQPLAAGLFPRNTEFLHSVYYIDMDDNDQVKLAARLKELRYARKVSWQTYYDLRTEADGEIREKAAFPDRLRQIRGNMENGVDNGQGWLYQGFIEDAQGQLRPQTYEEHVFCVGCHSRLGTLDDGIFSFSRKFDAATAFQGGWYHWTQKSLKGTPEPKRSDGEYEYSYYLQHNNAGDEFRANAEIIDKFFEANGTLKSAQIEALHADVTSLLWPSRARAMQLNKAYRTIVQEQSFIYGRDATLTPPANVHEKLAADTVTGVSNILSGR